MKNQIGMHTNAFLEVLVCWDALPFRTSQIICGKYILLKYILPSQTSKLFLFSFSLSLGMVEGIVCLIVSPLG